MRFDHRISVVIPAQNEEGSIAAVLDAIPVWVDETIVVNNASVDRTSEVALRHGARVVDEPYSGYGAACLRGIDAAGPSDIIVFLDADFSDVPAKMSHLVDPIIYRQADVTISDRTARSGNREVLSPAQYYGNRLACYLILLFWGHRYHDLGPFRAIRLSALNSLAMADRGFGWTVEMQIKAIVNQLLIAEVPVEYRNRLAGRSKISGTIAGVIQAGSKILYLIFREAIRK